ncbi:hypothetical protein F4678DRAFT_476682 [Xylaria arbuscula]|nr:hypothetical protein F4678DRAFT_476682 [Xylaria arbuscula]
MKPNKVFGAFCFNLLLNFTLVSCFAIASSRDLVVPTQDIFLSSRGRPGGSSKGSGSGSGSKGSKKTSSLKKGSDPDDADAELSSWGMTRGDHGSSEYPPTSFNWNEEANDLYNQVGKGTWEQYTIAPDDAHLTEYGSGEIYKYQTNQGAGAFHTHEVFTTEDPISHDPRTLPTNRRDLTYNAWIHAGGDPTKLQILSDENIVNTKARKAFEDTFAAKGLDVTLADTDQWVQINRNDPVWSKWDNGDNPFPDGYETMTIDYSDMQSTISYVMLYVDPLGEYHAVHVLEHVEDLERRLRDRAVYFLRRNLTDPWLI